MNLMWIALGYVCVLISLPQDPGVPRWLDYVAAMAGCTLIAFGPPH